MFVDQLYPAFTLFSIALHHLMMYQAISLVSHILSTTFTLGSARILLWLPMLRTVLHPNHRYINITIRASVDALRWLLSQCFRPSGYC